MTPSDSDESINLEGLRSGDPVAFRKLVMSQQDRVVNICNRFTRNRQDAEDVAQEVFIEIHRSIGKFRGDSKLSTWIYRVSVSRSLDFLRKGKRKKRFAVILDLFGLGEVGLEPAAPKSTDPERIALKHERSEVLATAVAKLSEKQRVAVTLTKYEGLSGQEVATIMDLSISAVEALVHRGTKNLREILRDYYEQAE